MMGTRSEKEPVRLAVIGTGAIAQVVHLPIFRERDDVELAVLADLDERKAEALSRRFAVPLVMEVSEVLEYDGVDAVVVCTPNSSHEEIALRAFEAGKHVFVERPIATTSAGAERMIAAAAEADRSLTVGLPHRYRVEAETVRGFVAGGELGRIRSVRGTRLMRRIPQQQPTWRQDRELAGGGALVDLGVTAIDLTLWMTGYPKIRRVTCVLTRRGDEPEEAATLMFVAEDDIAFTVEVGNDFRGTRDSWFTGVIGSEGSGTYPPLSVSKALGGRPVNVTPRVPRPRGGEDSYTNAYRRQIDEFIGTAKTWGAAKPDSAYEPPVDQVALMRLVEAAYLSGEQGREVAVE